MADHDDDFNFWAQHHQHQHQQRTKNYDNSCYGDSKGDGFQPRNGVGYEYGNLSCPPPNSRGEAFPLLLRHKHNHSSPLTTRRGRRRLEVMVDARKRLMEMVEDMPEESCFELSLKDIVEKAFVETNNNNNGEVEILNKTNLNIRGGPICRSESMDSGVFRLKMFFPSSLMRRRKKKSPSSSSRDCSKQLEDGSQKPPKSNKERWNITSILLDTWKNKNSHANNRNSSKSTGSSSSRYTYIATHIY